MAANATALLNVILEERATATGSSPDIAFETFAAEQILKSYDLSDDEIARGLVAGGNDGGIDGVWTFLGGAILEPDSAMLEDTFDTSAVKRATELELHVVQAKRQASFAETAIEKIATTLTLLLDLDRSDDDLSELLNADLVERALVFRRAWRRLAGRHPTIVVRASYASLGDAGAANAKVKRRQRDLEGGVRTQVPDAVAETRLFGARDLLDLHAQERPYSLALPFFENATRGNSHLALVSLQDYVAFLTDDSGAMRRYIFEWNVRDYEGDVEVNREIRASIEDEAAPEFWWLNNGVTILCSRASIVGKTFQLDDVQVVNGLQTSMTVFEALGSIKTDSASRQRAVLVRIIVTQDLATRDQVIRATNRQSPVPAASLRATDSVQRNVEEYFVRKGWYYDRRKNYYRNQGKPLERIIGIPYLAQAIMAIGLSEPDNSRARPSSLLKRDDDYRRIFDEAVSLEVVLFMAATQRAVDLYLRTPNAAASAAERTNLRFHVAMMAIARRVGARVYHPTQLSGVIGTAIADDEIERALVTVRRALVAEERQSGWTIDRVAKGKAFVERLFRSLQREWARARRRR